MATVTWSQDYFAKGEISPLLYSRVTLQQYYQGLKTAKNVVNYPQGTAGKRFGTKYLGTILDVTDADAIYFESFQYLNECTYIVVLRSGFIDVYLEGQRVASVASVITGELVTQVDHTVLSNLFRVTSGLYAPYDLTRTAGSANAITAFSTPNSTLTVTNALTLDGFWPARFTAVSLPDTTPQIHLGRTYFVRAITTTTIRIYANAVDAADNVDYFGINGSGTSANLIVLNTWNFTIPTIINLPFYDFNDSGATNQYRNTSTAFTLTDITGFGETITRVSGTFNFTSKYVGGVIISGPGRAIITAVNGTNEATINIVSPFEAFYSTFAVPGTLFFIGEPAWSDARGWPKKCSSYQNRAFFANTDLLSNGLWGSVSNDYNNFYSLETDDDLGISWFPTSDDVNSIQFIVPYRSLTVHTNTGVYSTPLSSDFAITPLTFSLGLQDTHPARTVQPFGIDNQIIALSGNDVNSLVWDGFNSAYTSSLVSVSNEQLIRTPIDQAPYTDLERAGSRYMLIVNEDGSLAIYQTLITEQVNGFTPAVLEQSYGNAYFRRVTSSASGRAWFATEREIATPQTPVALTTSVVTTEIFTATGHGMTVDEITAVTFTTSGVLQTSSPQIELLTYYWAVPIDANTFKVYESQEDATAEENAIESITIPANNNVVPNLLVVNCFIEELDFEAKVDCAGYYPGPTTTVPTPAVSSIGSLPRFNAQRVLMQGDGFGFETVGVNDTINFVAHGMDVEVSEAQFGFPINVEMTPLPLAIPEGGSYKMSNLIEPKHVRFATFLFADTIGGTITQNNQTFPIAMNTLSEIMPGDPPSPQTGSFEISVFNAWDDFKIDNFTINHSEPFDIKLTGIFYKVEI